MKNFPVSNGTLHSVYNYSLGIKIQANEKYNSILENKNVKVYQKKRLKDVNKRVPSSRRGV